MDRIRKYFDLNETKSYQRIDDDTCNDLNIDELFSLIDYTHSSIGQQYLYSSLRNIPYTNRVNEEWLTKLNNNQNLQSKLEKLLKRLDNADAYYLYPLINQKYIPFGKKKQFLFRVLQFAPLICSIIFYFSFNYWAILGVFLFFIINMIIHFKSKMTTFLYSGSIPQLYKLLYISNKTNEIPEIKNLNIDIDNELKIISPLRKKLSFFRFNSKLDSEITMIIWFVTEISRIFFLIEPINLNNIFTNIKEYKYHLLKIFDFIGYIDTIQSISKLRSEIKNYCLPIFSDENTLDIKDIYHPLITNCVENSFSLKENESFLIMGSNMSGKTTFVRTVGINVLTAQTINTCFAKQLTLSKQKIYSSISIQDNLIEGHSYYLSEILKIKNIVDNTSNGNNLILLDELLKGTNTLERVAGAKAILNYISNNNKNKILVASHDTELIKLLNKNFNPIYFSEKILDKTLSFDYKINYEQSLQRNAIRILQLYEFPESIITNALLSLPTT